MSFLPHSVRAVFTPGIFWFPNEGGAGFALSWIYVL